MPRVSRTSARVMLLAALLLTACREGPSGPAEARAVLSPLGDAVVYVQSGASQSEAIRVAATEPGTGAPLRGLAVNWRVVSGAASLTPSTSETDSHGVASTALRPSAAGTYRVEANVSRLVGVAPEFEVRVVPQPVISGMEPQIVAAGGELVVSGSDFGGGTDLKAVYFDGVRGEILSSSPTEIRVRVPACIPARNVQVTVGLGAVVSAARTLATTGAPRAVLSLVPGEVRTFTEAADLACVSLPAGQAGAIYLGIVHNTADMLLPPASFEFRSLTPRTPVLAAALGRAHDHEQFSHSWEASLRRSERELEGAGPDLLHAAAAAAGAAALPAVGERRDFNVLGTDGTFRKATATVRAVTARAIIYVDNDAESVFTADDLSYFGQLFDDPIYTTVTTVFGQPSDVDANERIVILFTPRVNELTPRNESSFVAGFFYGCDLVARSRCSGSNQAEVFYSVVPDPSARWGDARTAAQVRNAVPPVMAHEYQHMINFARRGFTSDVLWLSEALAHSAEDLVADALAARGQNALAAPFRNANLQRAQRYLSAPAATSLISDLSPGTLELRGAGWLFLKYLRGQHGGNDLLRRLTNTTRSGVANVIQETGQPWATLVTNFGVALWADGAPALRGPLDPRYQFIGFDLRTALTGLPAVYPLSPSTLGWRDFAVGGTVAASAHEYFAMTAPEDGSGATLNTVLAGARGAPLAPANNLRLSVLRIR